MKRSPRFPRLSGGLAVLLVLILVGTLRSAPTRGISIGSGDTATSGIQPADDVDTWKLDGYAGGSLNLSLTPGKGSGLEPSLEILDPTGAVVDASAYIKAKNGKIKLKKLPVTMSGMMSIVIGSLEGTEGSYVLKPKVSPPKKAKDKGQPLNPGETLDIVVPGKTDVAVSLKLKEKQGTAYEVMSVKDPDGKEIPGAKESIVFKGKVGKGTINLNGPVGDYVIRLGNAAAAAVIDIQWKAKHPKGQKQKMEVSPLEPVIDELEPAFARNGDTIAVRGENFQGGAIEVWFGDLKSPLAERISTTQVNARVPAGDGETAITVINPDGQSGTSDQDTVFTWIPGPPTITSATPDEGPDTGGTTIDVFGDTMTYVETVKLGEVAVTSFEIVDDTHLRFTTDAHASGLASLELIDQWEQSRVLIGAFRFWGAPNPVSVQPPTGPKTGGTELTIAGTQFHEDARVFIDGAEVTPVIQDSMTQLRVTSPAHVVGMVDLRVQGPWSRSGTLVNAFEYTEATFADVTDDQAPVNTSSAYYAGGSLALGDVDGDKRPDAVIGRIAEETIPPLTMPLANDGKGTFSAGSITKPPGNGDDWDAKSVALGDLDGDGDLDLVVTCLERFEQGAYKYAVGKMTYVVYNRPFSSTRVLMNDGSGAFSLSAGSIPDPKKKKGTDLLQGSSVTLGDVDGDNDLDLIVTSEKSIGESYYSQRTYSNIVYRSFKSQYNHNRPATRVLLNDGSGVFTDATSSSIPGVKDGDMFAGTCVRLGDVDGDSDLDLLVTGDQDSLRSSGAPEYVKGAKTRVLLNVYGAFSNATSTFMPATKDGDDWGGDGLAIDDLDGDNVKDDLVVTVNRGLSGSSGALPSTRLLLGTSSKFTDGTSSWIPSVRSDGQGEVWKGKDVAIADPEGDGKPDVFLVTTDKVYVEGTGGKFDKQITSLRWLANTGTLPLEDWTSVSMPDPADRGDYLQGHAIQLGDIDGDGDLDLLLTTELADYLKDGAKPTRILELK
jgi:hypothetical protein